MKVKVLVYQYCPILCNPTTVALHASLSMGFSRQEYCNGVPFPSPVDPADPGIEPTSLALIGRFFLPPSYLGSSQHILSPGNETTASKAYTNFKFAYIWTSKLLSEKFVHNLHSYQKCRRILPSKGL